MKPNIIQQGAEALIIHEGNSIIKDRISKKYRHPVLDEKIIKKRTKSEAKILEKASTLINAPKPTNLKEIEASKNHGALGHEIEMPFIKGDKLSEKLESLDYKKICKIIGNQIAKLHDNNIIHGDLTTSNMIWVEHPDKNNKALLEQALALNQKQQNDLHINPSKHVEAELVQASKQLNQKKEINNKSAKYSNPKQEIKPKPANDLQINKSKNVEAEPSNFTSLIHTKTSGIASKEQATSDYPKLFFIDFGLGFTSERFEDKAVDIHLIKQALEAKHFSIHKECEKIILENYNSKDREKTIEQLKKVEARGRYKH